MRVLRDQMQDHQGRPLEHLTGGEDEAIAFWLELTGKCEPDKHAELHRTMWSIIDKRPYRCLNHGDVEPTNIFKLNPQPRKSEDTDEPSPIRAESDGACNGVAAHEDETVPEKQAEKLRTARLQKMDSKPAQLQPEPELAWIDWQFTHAGVPGLDLAALLTRALVRYPEPVSDMYCPAVFQVLKCSTNVRKLITHLTLKVLVGIASHFFVHTHIAGCENGQHSPQMGHNWPSRRAMGLPSVYD